MYADRIFVSASWGICDAISRLGGKPDRVLEAAGLAREDLVDPMADIAVAQHCTLFEAAARTTGARHFGFLFGRVFRPQHLGPIGYLATSAPTLRRALVDLCRYHPAHQSSSRLSLNEDSEHACLTYRISDEFRGSADQETEMSLAALCNVMRIALGNSWQPDVLCFTHASTHKSDEVDIRFNQASNSIVFRRMLLDTLMPEPDPYLGAMMKSLLDHRQHADRPTNLLDRIREHIEMNLDGGTVSLRRIAAKLGTTENHLSHEIARNGSSFAELVSGVRQTLALRYMRDLSVSFTDIAYRLGYSELSAFSRAFRQWTGVSPMGYRSALQDGALHLK